MQVASLGGIPFGAFGCLMQYLKDRTSSFFVECGLFFIGAFCSSLGKIYMGILMKMAKSWR